MPNYCKLSLSPAQLDYAAASVNDAARVAPTEARHRGGRKVFVSEIQALCMTPGGRRYLPSWLVLFSVAEFKGLLVELNRLGLITLARFDLVRDHAAEVVEASEIYDAISTWHCVVDRAHKDEWKR